MTTVDAADFIAGLLSILPCVQAELTHLRQTLDAVTAAMEVREGRCISDHIIALPVIRTITLDLDTHCYMYSL